MVNSGKTIEESMKYLMNEKKVNLITPVCISLSEKYKNKIDIQYILPKIVFIWPWGYNN